jgi:uncharacterized membrane protein
MFIIVLAFLIGIVAGLRALTAPTAVSWGSPSWASSASRNLSRIFGLCGYALHLYVAGYRGVDQ